MTALSFVLLAAAVSLAPGDRRNVPTVGPRSAALAGPAGVAVAASAAGLACALTVPAPAGLVLAVIAAGGTAMGLRRMQQRPVRAAPDPALPLVLDLAAAALRSGRPLPEALALAAPAGRSDTAAELARVAGLARLGAEPAEAWSIVPPDGPLAAVVPVAVRSAASGSRLAAALERLAADLRAECSADAAARAHRAGVVALAPLAACFLPSFVCLGVVPVVIGIARTSLGLLP